MGSGSPWRVAWGAVLGGVAWCLWHRYGGGAPWGDALLGGVLWAVAWIVGMLLWRLWHGGGDRGGPDR
ncbi:MAG TPA: hypothetical protein VFY14_01740 [Streptomyces sp.]|nr:hypothetical protein [Streptomyces sp.]